MKRKTALSIIIISAFLISLLAGMQVVEFAEANFIPNAELVLISPTNRTYSTSSVILNFTVDFIWTKDRWVGYSLDGGDNVTIDEKMLFGEPYSNLSQSLAGILPLSGLSEGAHRLDVYAIPESSSFPAHEIVYFSIDLSSHSPSTSPTLTPSSIELPYAAGNFFPTPNSTNVPLNTKISISFGRPPSICDLNITPNVPIEERKFESEGFGGTYIFHLAEPLQLQTTYTATITFGQENASEGFAPTSTRTWNFTTLPQPQQPTLEPSPTLDNIQVENFAPTVIIVGLVALAVVVGVVVFFKKRKG